MSNDTDYQYVNEPVNGTSNYTQNYDYETFNGTANSTIYSGNYTNETLISYLEYEPSLAVEIVWLIGIAISTSCLILQIVLVIIRPKLRKLDQKILIQLTVARLLNSIMELLMTYQYFDDYTKDPTFALYLQTDAVLVSWMFVFTKNLYDKVVVVFVTYKCNFLLLSVLIWTLTIPVGILCPVSLQNGFYIELYKTYAWVKFIVLTMNLLFFARIFWVIINKSNTGNRNMKNIVKTCIISFLLVILTSLQVFINDILSYLEVTAVSEAFCLINSFQVVPATVIFLILAQNSN